jgi:hypothetical protein
VCTWLYTGSLHNNRQKHDCAVALMWKLNMFKRGIYRRHRDKRWSIMVLCCENLAGLEEHFLHFLSLCSSRSELHKRALRDVEKRDDTVVLFSKFAVSVQSELLTSLTWNSKRALESSYC